jgi:hypothetical protein
MTLAFLNKRDLEDGFFDDILAITSDALDSEDFARDDLDSDAFASDAFFGDLGEPFIIASTAL